MTFLISFVILITSSAKKNYAERGNQKMYQHNLETMNNISYDRQRELEKVRYENYLHKLVDEGLPAKESLDLLKPFRALVNLFLNLNNSQKSTIYRRHELDCQNVLTPCS